MEELLKYDIGNLQGIGAREDQEDSFGFVNALDAGLIREKGLFAAVADGMGGMEGGREASSLVMKTLMSDFEKMDRSVSPGMQISRSIAHANDLVYSMLHGNGGSTVVAAVFFHEMLYFASVGDSTMWLVRNGEVIRLNEPHNMKYLRYHEAFYSGSMDPFEGRNDPQAHALTQHVGMRQLEEVDVSYSPLRLENQDVIILCSDGVGEILSEEEVLDCLEKTSSTEVCLEIDRHIRQKNLPFQDNYTALVIRCSY